MKILVTGGLGFVGINIVRGLAAQPGVQVVVADVLPWDEPIDRFLAPVQAQVSHRPLDVRDNAAVQELVSGEGITHIVHAAAITATEDEERTRAAEIVAVNLKGAAETGLRYFGFDKAIYENKRNIATRKWVEVSQKPIKEVFVQ